MSRVFIIANESDPIRKLKTDLAQTGLYCVIVPDSNEVDGQIGRQSPDLLLLDADEATIGSPIWELVQKQGKKGIYLLLRCCPERDSMTST